MATKTKPAAPKAPTTAKRSVARKPAAPIAEAPAGEATAAEAVKPNLLRAGLKALGNVRNDVVQHQSRVFEAILGIEPGQGWQGLVKRDAGAAQAAQAAQEAFGLRKFEAVFDQRVASALERMGLPPIDALNALTERVAALSGEVAALTAEVAALRAGPGAPKATARKR